MTEKKTTVATKKKVYKAPAQVKSVESGKIMTNSCASSCGQLVSWASSPCGK